MNFNTLDRVCISLVVFLVLVFISPINLACRFKSSGDGDVVITPPPIVLEADGFDVNVDAGEKTLAPAASLAAMPEAFAELERAALSTVETIPTPTECWLVRFDANGAETSRQRVLWIGVEGGVQWPVGQLWPSGTFPAGEKFRAGGGRVVVSVGGKP